MDEIKQHKINVEKEIVEKALREYEEGRLERNELKEIADYVTNGMTSVNDIFGLNSFLKALSTKWSIFTNIVIIEKGHQKEEEEGKIYEEAVDLVHHGNIDNAIKLAKTMTN